MNASDHLWYQRRDLASGFLSSPHVWGSRLPLHRTAPRKGSALGFYIGMPPIKAPLHALLALQRRRSLARRSARVRTCRTMPRGIRSGLILWGVVLDLVPRAAKQRASPLQMASVATQPLLPAVAAAVAAVGERVRKAPTPLQLWQADYRQEVAEYAATHLGPGGMPMHKTTAAKVRALRQRLQRVAARCGALRRVCSFGPSCGFAGHV